MEAANKMLGDRDRIHLTEPMEYFNFLNVMRQSHLILTDSGGIQEEAPVFGKPVLVLRETTERKEVLESGQGKLIGTQKESIVRETNRLLTQQSEYERMAHAKSLYGDGHAAEQILNVLSELDGPSLRKGDQ
jgi:UDP-N-acetylglucosamine 2-epimerase (non-hydrolysing)